MNSNSSSSYSSFALPALLLIGFGIYYTNGTQALINPTAHQSLTNRSFILFISYIAAIVAVVLVSIQSKSMTLFLTMLAALSAVWYIAGKSWQYVPS